MLVKRRSVSVVRRSRDERGDTVEATLVTIYRVWAGGALEIDQRFDHVFENGRGEVLLTTNPGYDPAHDPRLESADWTRLAQSR